MSQQKSAGAKTRWDLNYETDHAQQEQICNIYTLASVLYWQLYGNPCLSNTGSEYRWLSWLKRVNGTPRRLRRCYPYGKIKRGVARPTIPSMIAIDPSEAVRSEEIIPLFTQQFTVEHCIDFGGSISTLVLDDIVSNFRMEDPQSLRWFKLILGVDHRMRKANLAPTVNVVMAGRARSIAARPAHSRIHAANSPKHLDKGATLNA